MEITLIISGLIAYTLKAMQPTHFLDWIPNILRFHCFPCYSFWVSFLIFYCYHLVAIYFGFELINVLLFIPSGAIGYTLFKFME